MYSGDNDEYSCPAYIGSDSSCSIIYWYQDILINYISDYRVYKCRSNTKNHKITAKRPNNGSYPDSFEHSYGKLQALNGCLKGNVAKWCNKTTNFRTPSITIDTFDMTESICVETSDYAPYVIGYSNQIHEITTDNTHSDRTKYLGLWHGNRFNALFFDGHVSKQAECTLNNWLKYTNDTLPDRVPAN